MFTTREAVQAATGIEIDAQTLSVAQMMIEAYIGKREADVVNGSDRSVLALAVTFQAAYINGKAQDMLEQVAINKITVGSTNTEFNTDLMAPFMAPMAVHACKLLSWRGTRTVNTGRMLGGRSYGSFYDYWRRT